MNYEYISPTMEVGLLTLVNEYLDDIDVYLGEGEYYRLNFRMWDNDRTDSFIKDMKFKDIGNIFDYPYVLPQPEQFDGRDLSVGFDKNNRILVSEKYNSIMLFNRLEYTNIVSCLIEKKYLKKFSKKLNLLFQSIDSNGIFNNTDFKCKKKEFIEISDIINEDDKYCNIQKKKVPNEILVFDTNSNIFRVMEDIKLFFKPETKKLYEKMNILYKRGIILYGDPGNGKSAMIREIIRQLPNITKIIINPNIPRPVFILSSLIDSLKGKPSLIVIEDLDSVINKSNRSEFLNILDGINIKSGVYFIGTTNYPERIDPAFVNRSGRFDRSYQIDNPSPTVRKAFFKSCSIDTLLDGFKIYKDDSKNTDLDIIGLFVKYSEGLSMANLKELMISTQYMLISNKNETIENAIESNYNILTENKKEHDNEYKKEYDRKRRYYDEM